MATDNLLLSFDLSEFREGVKALVLYKHGGDTVPAIGRCSELLSRFADEIPRELGRFSFEDAVRIIDESWGELLFSEDELDDGEVPQCTIDIVKELGLSWNTHNTGYGLVFTDNEEDYLRFEESLSDCFVVCQGTFVIHKDRPPVFEGWLFSTTPADEADGDEDDVPVLDECFARLIDPDGTVFAAGAHEEAEYDRQEYTDEQWVFLSGFFENGDREHGLDVGGFEELGYCFENGEMYVVNDEEGTPLFFVSPLEG